MAKFLQSFSFLFIVFLLLSGTMVNQVAGECQRQKVMDVYCRRADFDTRCIERCREEDELALSNCLKAPGLPAGFFLCLCTYPCP